MQIENAEARAASISRDNLDLPTSFAAPCGELEAQIATIFAEILGVDQVGADDDFFDLGGDSLLAETLSMEIFHRTSHDFEISWLLDSGTPRMIAKLFANGQPSALYSADRPPIFAVHGRFGFMLPAPAFLDGLAPGQQFRMFELPGIRGGKKACKRIEDIASSYVAQLNEEYPEGAVFLSAFCHGALIALEMATQLDRMGRTVRQLVLMDPGVPHALVRNYRRQTGFIEKRRTRPADIASWLRKQWVSFGYLIVLGRWTDGSRDSDFADERLRYFRERQVRLQMWLRRLKGRRNRKKENGYEFSDDAQAKLVTAYRHYRPRRFTGPAVILYSAEKRHYSEDENRIWADLLPQRRMLTVGKSHRDVIMPNSSKPGRVIQEIFSAASAEF